MYATDIITPPRCAAIYQRPNDSPEWNEEYEDASNNGVRCDGPLGHEDFPSAHPWYRRNHYRGKFVWRDLDRCQTPGCQRYGVPGNENVVNGLLVCDYCHAVDIAKRCRERSK